MNLAAIINVGPFRRSAVTGLLLCFSVTVAAAEDWPRWRGPSGDGTWNAPPLATVWPKDGLPRVWQAKVGPGYAGVAVAQGRVVTMDRPAEPADRERVVCFDADNGRLLWQHIYPAKYVDLDYGRKGPRAMPTIHDGRVYTLGAVGHFHCLDASNGKVLWSKDLVADHKAGQPTWGFAASPLVYRDLVIVHAGLKPDGCYTAYDRKTGKEIWRSGDDPAGYGTPILIRHDGEDRLIGWTPEHVVCLAPQTGKQLWSVPHKVTSGVSIATPIFQDGTVFVSGYWNGSMAIRFGETKEPATIAWEENRYLRGLMSQPLGRDGYVYLLDKYHGLVCFKLVNGKKIWTDKNRLTPRARNPQASLVWLGNSDRILALNSEGELVQARLTPKGYEELTRTKIVGPTWAHPAYSGNSIFARDDKEIVRVRLTPRS